MVWHIFKKDWKLIRGFVITVALLHWIAAIVRFTLGIFGEDEMLIMLAQVLPGLAFFGSMFLIGAIVHLEAIPGVRQDWLARPVPRGTLLLEKFLFVVMVAGPIFVGNLLLGLAGGFSLRSSLMSTSSYVIYVTFLIVLPIFAFASVTRN